MTTEQKELENGRANDAQPSGPVTAVEFNGVTKGFGDRKVLDEISFSLPMGEGAMHSGAQRHGKECDAAPDDWAAEGG